MTNLPEIRLHYRGLVIRRQPESGLICLTDIWKAQRSPSESSPSAWACLNTTQALLRRLAEQKAPPSEEIITAIPGILETTQEAGELLTYSTPELTIVYARYLSTECYEWTLTALVERSDDVANLVEQKDISLEDEIQLSRRRALIAAGWAVPVIASVAMPYNVRAQSPVTFVRMDPGFVKSIPFAKSPPPFDAFANVPLPPPFNKDVS